MYGVGLYGADTYEVGLSDTVLFATGTSGFVFGASTTAPWPGSSSAFAYAASGEAAYGVAASVSYPFGSVGPIPWAASSAPYLFTGTGTATSLGVPIILSPASGDYSYGTDSVPLWVPFAVAYTYLASTAAPWAGASAAFVYAASGTAALRVDGGASYSFTPSAAVEPVATATMLYPFTTAGGVAIATAADALFLYAPTGKHLKLYLRAGHVGIDIVAPLVGVRSHLVRAG